MNQNITFLKEFYLSNRHLMFRKPLKENYAQAFSQKMHDGKMSQMARMTIGFTAMLHLEKAEIVPGEMLVGMRTIDSLIPMHTFGEYRRLHETNYMIDGGYVQCALPDYAALLEGGIGQLLKQAKERMQRGDCQQPEIELLTSIDMSLKGVQRWITKYATKAKIQQDMELFLTLSSLQKNCPYSLNEALQLLRIMQVMFVEAGYGMMPLGRIDQYLYRIYKTDTKQADFSESDTLDRIEEFILQSIKDAPSSDSPMGALMTLGGSSADGTSDFNELTYLFLRAAAELDLPYPAVVVRMGKHVGEEAKARVSEAMKQSKRSILVSDEDVLIPKLLDSGYECEDAYNYALSLTGIPVVAGRSLVVPQLDWVSWVDLILDVLTEELPACKDFEALTARLTSACRRLGDRLETKYDKLYIFPAPLLTAFMDGGIEQCRDISKGTRYNEWFIHAVHGQAAEVILGLLKHTYYKEQKWTADEFIKSLDEKLRNGMEWSSEWGSREETSQLMHTLTDALFGRFKDKKNNMGGRFHLLEHAE